MDLTLRKETRFSLSVDHLPTRKSWCKHEKLDRNRGPHWTPNEPSHIIKLKYKGMKRLWKP